MPCICHADKKSVDETKHAINSHCRAIANLIKDLRKEGDWSEDFVELSKKAIEHHLNGCDEKGTKRNFNTP